MAPPSVAPLPENVQLVMFSVPPIELKMAPPPTALLPVNVESVTVRSPLLRTPPPLPVELPFEIVRSFRVSVPVRLRKMRLALPPSISIVWPVPSISRTPVGDGSVLATVILPLKLKTIVSLAVPATQSPLVVSDPLLELVIASRRLHTPSPAVLESESVLTVIVLAACSELRRVRTDSIVSRTSAANTAGRTMPLAKRPAAAGRLTPLTTDAFTLGPPCFVKQGWALPLRFDLYPKQTTRSWSGPGQADDVRAGRIAADSYRHAGAFRRSSRSRGEGHRDRAGGVG